MEWLYYIACGAAGYILGNFSFAYIFGRFFANQDIRELGSGNAGTTNMLRSYGKKVGFLTFVMDALKGVGAVLLGRLIAGENGGYVAAVLVVVGHNWPVLLGFRGGKGIATTAGIIFTVFPLEGLVLFLICIVIIALFKYVSLGSLCGCLGIIVISFVFGQGNVFQNICFAIIGVLGVVSHRENIKRLAKGNENKLVFSKLKP